MIDTVGFVGQLPEKLIEAFGNVRGSVHAHLICVVVDATSEAQAEELNWMNRVI